jgi:predicted aldo/keto reductase-like oxidoreductase
MLREYNLPVWVMEPVRGGKLVSLEEDYEKILKEARPEASVVEWAFRFLQTIPEVGMTLSGMSNFEQLRQNIATYETEKPLNDVEWNTLLGVAQKMTEKDTLPCTACRYCTAHCPMELDIPTLIELYNEFNYAKGAFVPQMVVKSLPEEKRPAACLSCHACEAVCPQNIKISEMMSDFTEKLNK